MTSNLHWNFVMSNGKEEIGTCPLCSGHDIAYGSLSIEFLPLIQTNMLSREWECENCGSEGKEWYDITFSKHHITRNNYNSPV